MTAPQSALLKHRKSLGVTQVHLAQRAHIGQGDIVSFEKGRRLPTIAQAKRIASVLGLKVTALFTDGFREQSHHGGWIGEPYRPPDDAPRSAVPYPSHCPRCRAQAIGTRCYACGKDFEAMTRGEVNG